MTGRGLMRLFWEVAMFEHTQTEADMIRLRMRDAWRYRLLMTTRERRRLYGLLRRDIKRLRALNKSTQ